MFRIAIYLLACLAGSVKIAAATEPQLYVWEWDQLVETKDAMSAPAPELKRNLKALRKDADRALKNRSYSVTYNEFVPPSGDAHDYTSFGAYWWPDPSKEDGLPFIRRDGETNEAQKALGDKNHLNSFIKDTETLSLAYYYFEDEAYAEHAIHLVNDWFLNPETRMNPHLEYAQAVPGRNHGKNSGVIDTRDFTYVLESLELLKSSPAYSSEFEGELKEWFGQFLHWLRTSKLGTKESRAPNNHGSWYHVQAMRIALFLEDRGTAGELAENVRDNLIASQILPDGTQPEELARTNTFHYSLFNLYALGTIARMAESLDIDLWHHRTAEGAGIEVAAEFLLPYVKGDAAWPHEQISKYKISPQTNQLLRMMSVRYKEPDWLDVSEKYWSDYAADHSRLVTAAYQEDLRAE